MGVTNTASLSRIILFKGTSSQKTASKFKESLTLKKLQKVAINITLQLDPQHGFNYEAHNAPAYKFNNSTKDVSAVDENLCVFGQLYTAHAQRLLF